jgi:hypothetical protein
MVRLAPDEAVALAAIGGQGLPPVVTSVAAEGDVVRVTADLRRLDDLPGPLKLAARLAPIVRADVRVLGFAHGVVTLGVEVNAAGLPVGKLLGLLASPLEHLLVSKGLPRNAVDIRSDGTVAVDVEVLLADRLPGLDVTRVAVEDGEVVLQASVG